MSSGKKTRRFWVGYRIGQRDARMGREALYLDYTRNEWASGYETGYYEVLKRR